MAPVTVERTTIYCHACTRYLTVEIDLSLDGNHIAICPCGHEHYREVKGGKVTDVRWSSMNGDLPVENLNGARKFQGKSAHSPIPIPQPAPLQTFTMTIVYTSFQPNTGGVSISVNGNQDAQMFKMFIQESWTNSTSATLSPWQTQTSTIGG